MWSLTGEEAVSYSLPGAGQRKGSSSHSGEWRDSGVLSGAMAWREQSSLLHLGGPGQRENTETVAKLPQPAQPIYRAWGARPKDHVITNSACLAPSLRA